jgi:hypothetical protein
MRCEPPCGRDGNVTNGSLARKAEPTAARFEAFMRTCGATRPYRSSRDFLPRASLQHRKPVS